MHIMSAPIEYNFRDPDRCVEKAMVKKSLRNTVGTCNFAGLCFFNLRVYTKE